MKTKTMLNLGIYVTIIFALFGCGSSHSCRRVDIIFVVDGSGSISNNDFKIVKEWLIDITTILWSKFGRSVSMEVLQYSNKDPSFLNVPIASSTKFDIPFRLGECNSVECMSEAIQSLGHLKQQTFTYYALRRVIEVEFPRSPYYGNSDKFVILLTDGQANDAYDLHKWSPVAASENITTFVIGVGDYDSHQLRQIASSSQNVFAATNFNQISSITSSIGTSIQRKRTVCGPADIIFVVDGSGSISDSNFEKMKEWLINITASLWGKFGQSASIEVLQYSNKDPSFLNVPIANSTKFIIPFHLGECNSVECMSNRIQNMGHLKQQTFTYYALRRVIEVEFPRSKFYNISKKFVIVLTDGQASDAYDLHKWNPAATAQNITTFAVGVGSYDLSQLQLIANGNGTNQWVNTTADFDGLLTLTDGLVEEIESEWIQ